MSYNAAKVDEAVLALLYLNLHGSPTNARAWKGYDWDAMTRLFMKGLISDPRSRAKSVALSTEGVAECKAAFERLFGAT